MTSHEALVRFVANQLLTTVTRVRSANQLPGTLRPRARSCLCGAQVLKSEVQEIREGKEQIFTVISRQCWSSSVPRSCKSALCVCVMGTLRNGWTKRESFILSVDVGTTSVRCHVYDKHANIRGSCTRKVTKHTRVSSPAP